MAFLIRGRRSKSWNVEKVFMGFKVVQIAELGNQAARFKHHCDAAPTVKILGLLNIISPALGVKYNPCKYMMPETVASEPVSS